VLQGKLDTEDLLRRSGVNFTSIRPVYIYGATMCFTRVVGVALHDIWLTVLACMHSTGVGAKCL
jgi:hypothetical protein